MNKLTTLCFVAFFTFISLTLVASQGSNGFNDPCWQKFCHIYAKCVKNGTEAICVCPQNCSKEKVPVCGTDWKTYDNMCELMATSCSKNGLTRLRYQGECEAGSCRKTQWESMLRCPYYSKCFLNKGLPTCACPKWKCSPTYEPVCGSNGKTYINICHLRKAGCEKRIWLSVKRMGHCLPDPCNSLSCCCGAVCRINATSQATCQCNIVCNQQIDLVCGSDGNTYKSPCDLRSAACTEQNPTLIVSTRGPCPTAKPTAPPSPCDLIKCAFYATCQAHLGMAKCTCPDDCQDAPPNPICGDDGITYHSICEMTKASCTTQTRIKVASNGVCLIPAPVSPCSSVRCPKYASCTVVEGRARCVCARSCPPGGTPVCGSDGITYTNECNLKKTSCEYSKNTTLVKFGPCDPSPNSPCFLVECLYYSKCLVNYTYAICVCPSNCPVSGTNQVCGSDFITYDNECVLRRTACLHKKNITVTHVGPCGVPTTPTPLNACNGKKCKHYATCKDVNGQATCVCPNNCMVFSAQIPVCGSDGITYPSNCDLQIQSCRQQKPVSLVKMGICGGSTAKQGTLMGTCSDGKCGYYATCEVDGSGGIRCVCPKSCPDVYEPVCDQHGINHKNQCYLKVTSCKTQREITIAKKGVCESKRCPIPKGCFTFCKTPVWIAGRLVCPPEPLVCLNDNECTGGRICCRDGCTRKCVLPRH